jgi:hypothetical protein
MAYQLNLDPEKSAETIFKIHKFEKVWHVGKFHQDI